MIDKNKQNSQDFYPIPPPMSIDDFFESKENIEKSFIEKKGFPIGINIFWGFISFLWLFKMLYLVIFLVPAHLPVAQKIKNMKSLMMETKYVNAMAIHMDLMNKYPLYKSSYYFEIALSYIATSNFEGHFKKGLELLVDKKLTEDKFISLKSTAPEQCRKYFDTFFLIYRDLKYNKKIYMVDVNNLELL